MRPHHLDPAPPAARSPRGARPAIVTALRTRLPLVLVLLAAIGAVTLATPSAAHARINAVGIDLCAQTGYAAGFRGNNLVVAVAVAMAESSCNQYATASNPGDGGYCPNGSTDRGLWQINSCWHSEYSQACVFDAQCNANAAYVISSHGTNWNQWYTWLYGTYLSYMSSAQAAVDRLVGNPPPPSTVPGTILASPYLNVRTGPGTGYGSAGVANYYDVVNISCWTTGDYVSGGYWPSSTWDRIVDPVTGASGYAADTWISTTSDVKTMVGHC